MTTLITFFALAALSFPAGAVGYSANLGLDWTQARATAGRAGARANARFGFGMRWDLGGEWAIETGTDYVFRRVDWTRADGVRVAIDFDYVDVPATVRRRLTPWLGVFAGGRFGINVLDKPEVRRPTPSFDPGAHAVIALGEFGLWVDLSPELALDLSFEREFGDFARDLREYQSSGLRAVYLF